MNKEKVRELVEELRGLDTDEYEAEIIYWLEQNQPSPQVVGLSDEQVKELTTHFVCERPKANSTKEVHGVITNYLKTQTFAQPRSLEPNWGDVDERANKFTVIAGYSGNGYSDVSELEVFYRPSQPAPVIDVGQVWSFNNINHNVVATTKIDGIHYVVVDSIYSDNPYPSFKVEDFLAKFNRVRGKRCNS